MDDGGLVGGSLRQAHRGKRVTCQTSLGPPFGWSRVRRGLLGGGAMKTCKRAEAHSDQGGGDGHDPDRRRSQAQLTITAAECALRKNIRGRNGEKGHLGHVTHVPK